MDSLKGLGPQPGPKRLYGPEKEKTVALIVQVQNHMLFNPGYKPDDEDFIRECLVNAREGKVMREDRNRLASMVRRFREETGG